MAIHRRRYNNHHYSKRFRYIIPLISVTILFIYVFISLLAPSPDHLHHRTTLSDNDD
nr:GDP-fucose protein O-fucosyltransferase [Tanacetum cinerariifolium]